jgi:inner membrane protein
MDSITHIVLGACVGEALLGRHVGKKAMLMGAMAQSLPDIDFVASFWLDTADDLLAHRGITHSLLFVGVMSPLLAATAKRSVTNSPAFGSWLVFFLIEMLIHLFLDAFNNYGVGWFEPFSHIRVSFQAIYVADPLITIWPLVATVVLLVMRGRIEERRKWWRAALMLSSIYLLVCVFNKYQIDRQARRAFLSQNLNHDRYFTTPAPLQSLLWMVVAHDGDGFHVGYRSVLDSSPNIDFNYFPVNEQKLTGLAHHGEIAKLKRFSQGYYTVEQWGDTVVFNDLRFGQIIGWHDPKERFVFHYFLTHEADNDLVVQRGRFAKWNAEVARSFFRRILGDQAITPSQKQ